MMNNLYNSTNNKSLTFNGLEVLSNLTLSEAYLSSIYNLMDRAMAEQARTTVLRFDLHLPNLQTYLEEPTQEYSSNVITRFIESFKAQVRAGIAKKEREGKRVHPCTIRYVWAKEMNAATQPHYHVALILNKDAYFGFGDYRELRNNLAGKLYRAWASALMYENPEDVVSLIHIPSDTPYYHLDRNSSDYLQQCNDVFRRLSYLAKYETKQYGSRSKNFSCSRV
ncbi:inovirus Gp2 family protein [Motilimonas pumila]|uniref:Inovirus Gp2 family protein n=1 Tax=Motilimonas pumila TaxID=2303987 RepID=A0A418YAS6_9GAMM|nr:inovirus Gp2 family protein [Motilimonas pumila]RJG40060.1 inovirus Gp2 family protein [Motilimonas pumila]